MRDQIRTNTRRPPTSENHGHGTAVGLLVAFGVVLATGPAFAQVSTPHAGVSSAPAITIADAEVIASGGPAGNGRFAMTPVDGGFLRMDTDTGTVSLCAKKPAGWTCETVADDYKALQKDADRLAKENDALKREMAELRKEGANGGPQAKVERKIELPTEEEVDKALGQVDKYLKKFKGLIEKYQNPEAPAPGRT